MKEMGITFEEHLGTRWFFLQINYIILPDKSLKSKIGRKWPEQCHFLNWNLNYLFWESYHTNVRRLAEVTQKWEEVTFPHSKVIDTRGQVCGHSDKCRSSPSLLCHLDDRNFCRNLVQGTWVSNKSAIMYHYFVSTICPEGVTNSIFITWGARFW